MACVRQSLITPPGEGRVSQLLAQACDCFLTLSVSANACKSTLKSVNKPAHADAVGDPEVGRPFGRRGRKFLGFTWPEIKLLACIIAVLTLAINGGVSM